MMESESVIQDRRRFSELFNPRESETSSESPPEEDDQMEAFVEAPQSQEDEAPPALRRSSRKKIRTTLPEIIPVADRPIRLTARSSENEIKKYYLDKKVKRTNLSLETIYEEPQVINNKEVTMSTRKFKRLINCDVMNTKNPAKIKKRRNRMKKLKLKKAAKVTLELLMDKLNEID